MSTRHPRVQVTKDPELTLGLREAAPFLEQGMPVSQQIRELALIGARHLAEQPLNEDEVEQRLRRLAERFASGGAGYDWEGLRAGKADAWRFHP